LFQALDDNTVVQRTKLHFISFNAFAVRLAAAAQRPVRVSECMLAEDWASAPAAHATFASTRVW